MASVGFFEEAPGVKSSTRIFAAILIACVVAVVTVTCIYILHTPEAAVIGAIAAVLGALVYNGAVAISKRTRVTSTETLVEGSKGDDH